MDEFNDTKNKYCGLDIGTAGLRLVELRPGVSSPGLVSYASTPLPADLLSSDSDAERTQLAEIISRLIVQSGTTAETVVAAVSASKTVTAVISVPQQDEAELQRTMEYQAEQQLHMSISEIKADWYVLGPLAGDTSQQRVLLVAAPRSVVDAYTQIIAKAGLGLLALETDTLALARSLSASPEVPVLIIDFGSSSTKMALVWQYLPQLTRALPLGHVSLINAVSQGLNIDADQARQFLQKFGVSQTKLEGQVFKAVHELLNQIVSEACRLLEAFTARQAGVPLEKVVLTGDLANTPELSAYLADELHLLSEVGNPWAGVSYPPAEQAALMSQSLQFAVAVGLAQRSYI